MNCLPTNRSLGIERLDDHLLEVDGEVEVVSCALSKERLLDASSDVARNGLAQAIAVAAAGTQAPPNLLPPSSPAAWKR